MAVGDAVVGRQGCRHDLAGNDLPFSDPRALDELAESHQCDLWRINDAEDALNPLLAQAGYRNGRVGQL